MVKDKKLVVSRFIREEVTDRELESYHPVWQRISEIDSSRKGNVTIMVDREELEYLLWEARLYADGGYDYDMTLPYIRLRDQILKRLAE